MRGSETTIVEAQRRADDKSACGARRCDAKRAERNDNIVVFRIELLNIEKGYKDKRADKAVATPLR